MRNIKFSKIKEAKMIKMMAVPNGKRGFIAYSYFCTDYCTYEKFSHFKAYGKNIFMLV